MKFEVGDCVKNKVKKSYSNGDVIEVGTQGRVIIVHELSERYTVMFQGAKSTHWVPEKDLESC